MNLQEVAAPHALSAAASSRPSSPRRSHHCVTWKPVCRVGVGGVIEGRYSILHLSFFRRVQETAAQIALKGFEKGFFFSFFSPEIFGPMWYLPMKTTWVHLCVSWFAPWGRKSFNCQGSPETSFSIACTCLYKHRKVGLRQHHRQSFLEHAFVHGT